MNVRQRLEELERDITTVRGRALDTQVAGNHYKDLAIQPVEYITRNNISYLEGNVIKYITRHAAKGGAEDVRKAIHYCELILEMRYPVPLPTMSPEQSDIPDPPNHWVCSCAHKDLVVPIGQECPICKP